MRLLIGPAADFSFLLHINHFTFATKYERRRENMVANKTPASYNKDKKIPTSLSRNIDAAEATNMPKRYWETSRFCQESSRKW